MESEASGGQSYSLSNDDINKILEPDTKIWTYPDFKDMSSIDECWDSKGRCIFLFLTKSEREGHWIAMWKKGDTIHYFDPYGMKPEAGRSWLSHDQLEDLDMGEPYLYNLLKNSGYKVVYNTVPYQSKDGAVATCGRWAVLRLLWKDVSDAEFKRRVKDSGMSPDEFVTAITSDVLGK